MADMADARGDDAAASVDDCDTTWLRVGTSFVPDLRDVARRSRRDDRDSDVESSALQVYRGKRSSSKTHKKSAKKSAKKSSKEKHTHRHKSSSKRYRRSEYSNSSDSDRRSSDNTSISERDADSRQLTKRSRSTKRDRRRDHRRRSRSRSRSSDSNSDRHRRRRRELKRLHAADSLSTHSTSLVASAPREVRAWLEQQPNAIDTCDASGAALFEFDCAGDRENAQFGSLYAHDAPLYTLATRRNVFTGAWLVEQRPRVDRKAASTIGTTAAIDRSDDARYFGTNARLMERDARQQRLYLAYSAKRLARARERSTAAAPASQQSAATQPAPALSEMTYIPLDPSPELYATASSAGAESDLVMRTETANIEAYVVARSRTLNAALQQRPHDVARWLDLVAFQEQSARLVRSSTRISSSDAAAAMVVAKQRAVLDRAVAANPASRELQRVQLHFAMRFGNSVDSSASPPKPLDTDALRQQLEVMVERDPRNAMLWRLLLAQRLQHFASFSMPSARELYARVLAVVRKELAKVVAHEVSTMSTANSTRAEPAVDDVSLAGHSSVQIFGTGSLLATTPHSLRHVLVTSRRVTSLVSLLLRFHARLCRLERKAGYTERAVALLQALLAFNATRDAAVTRAQNALASTSNINNSSESAALQALEQLHLELQQQFAAQWEAPSASHFGDDWPAPHDNGADSTDSHESDQLTTAMHVPSASAFEQLVREQIVTSANAVNPPASVQTAEHLAQLQQLAGDANCERVRAASTSDGISSDSTAKRDEPEPTHRVVYSNVHGRRIEVDAIDDASEYERILAELRGHDAAVARHEARASRSAKQHAAAAQVLAQYHDERADFAAVDAAELAWLQREETSDATQWLPLRASVAAHTALIDEQPDRAVLTDELEPFVFLVPRAMRLRVVVYLLALAGVQLRCSSSCRMDTSIDNDDGDDSVDDDDDDDEVYADGLDEFEDLVAPIVSAMNATSTASLLLTPLQRRDRLAFELLDDVRVASLTLADPTKVAFVRNVLRRSLDVCVAEHDRDSAQVVRRLWIAFEAHVVVSVSSSSECDRDAAAAAARTFCQQLIASAAMPTLTKPTTTDVALLFAYAKLELRIGNARQVARVCDRTLTSLALPTASDATMDRSFHALLFLRARSEMWHADSLSSASSSSSVSSAALALRRLKTLYVLWSCWQSDWEPLATLEKTHRKPPRALYQHLKRVLTPAVQAAVVEKYRVELEIAVQHELKTQRTTTATAADAMMARDLALWRVGYCAHNLCLAVYATADLSASCREYEMLLAAETTSSMSALQLTLQQRRWLHLCWLESMQQHAASGAFPPVAPRAWRHAVSAAIASAPHDALLLRLFVDAETSNTVSQSLRLHLDAVRTRAQRHFDSPRLVEWLFALLCEFSRLERAAVVSAAATTTSAAAVGATCCVLHKYAANVTGLERVRRVFHDMVESSRTQSCALGWRLLLRFEVAVGNVERARRAFYRGVAKCPWSKALFVDGVRVLRPYLSTHESAELLELMAAKELHVRDV